ncbi:hypothetical protein ESZ53_04560 [Salinibacterium sp. UTAS2018]|uniref:hypothetical protein n=1 Tax=Salinibacterium sp. UTAS2018 TaxID=2508880 RepID=UPI0010095E39|nr:hypothetical protein [Salinibacterium sp. UTAS2018]QAV69771.1 hypothetical protein ESZ53_04560 [Salinibacterium sp. UTAS2018]
MILEWWNDLVDWFSSDQGWTFITSALVPFLAIVVGGIIVGMIARSSLRRLIGQQDRQAKVAAVAALIASGRRAAAWSTLSAGEKEHVDHQSSEAEVRVRLLPLKGADIAADWAAHKLAAMKKNSVNYSFQAEQDLAELQDGLIEWQSRPGRAKKLFAQDLASWKYETSEAEDELVVKQQEWASRQAAESTTAPAASTSGTAGSGTTSATSEATPTVVISPDRN